MGQGSTTQHHNVQGGSLKITKVADKEPIESKVLALSPPDAAHSGLPPRGETRVRSRNASQEKFGTGTPEKSINIASKGGSKPRAQTTSKTSVTQEKAINKGSSTVEGQGNIDLTINMVLSSFLYIIFCTFRQNLPCKIQVFC